MKPSDRTLAPPPPPLSSAGRELWNRIETATLVRNFGAVDDAMARCAGAEIRGDVSERDAELIRRAGRTAIKEMHHAESRRISIAKAAAVEKQRRIDQSTNAVLPPDFFTRADHCDWAAQLFASPTAAKSRARKGGK
jgi:hypothetical protein